MGDIFFGSFYLLVRFVRSRDSHWFILLDVELFSLGFFS